MKHEGSTRNDSQHCAFEISASISGTDLSEAAVAVTGSEILIPWQKLNLGSLDENQATGPVRAKGWKLFFWIFASSEKAIHLEAETIK